MIFFFQAEDGIRDLTVTGVQTCALPISYSRKGSSQNVESLFEIEPPKKDYQPTLTQLRELSHQPLARSAVDLLKPFVFDSDISNKFLRCAPPVSGGRNQAGPVCGPAQFFAGVEQDR